MLLLSKLLNKIAIKSRKLSRKIQYKKHIVKHIDCFETVIACLKYCKPKIVYDIGAHKGIWTYVLSNLCSSLEHVIFFEPQKQYLHYLEKLKLLNAKKTILQYGLGNKDKKIFLKGGTASASFLDAISIQNELFPNTFKENEREEVEIKILDNVCKEKVLPIPDLIKLDVQGYELEVLKGASDILKKTKYLVIELCYQQFYQKQPKLWQIEKYLSEHSFIMIDHGYELRSKNGTLLQTDGIFVNMDIAGKYGN